MSHLDNNQGLLKEIGNQLVTINNFIPQLKPCLLNRRINLRDLVTFWSNPMMIGCTHGDISSRLYVVYHWIAKLHLNMGIIREAAALVPTQWQFPSSVSCEHHYEYTISFGCILPWPHYLTTHMVWFCTSSQYSIQPSKILSKYEERGLTKLLNVMICLYLAGKCVPL